MLRTAIVLWFGRTSMDSMTTLPASRRSSQFSTCPSLQIQYRATTELKAQLDNPRVHSDKQIRQIANSIQAFGFNVPVLIDAERRVIAGHGRLEACKLLNVEKVPTIMLENLTSAEIRAFMIADNRLTEIAIWDEQLLGKNFRPFPEWNFTSPL